jgi:hypothetical protein
VTDAVRTIVEKYIPAGAVSRASAVYSAIEKHTDENAILSELDAFATQVQEVRDALAASFDMDEIEFFHCGDEHCGSGFAIRRDKLSEVIAEQVRFGGDGTEAYSGDAPFRVYVEHDSFYHRECGGGITLYDVNGDEITFERFHEAAEREPEAGTGDLLWHLMLNPPACEDQHHDPTNCTACHVRRDADAKALGVEAATL